MFFLHGSQYKQLLIETKNSRVNNLYFYSYLFFYINLDINSFEYKGRVISIFYNIGFKKINYIINM